MHRKTHQKNYGRRSTENVCNIVECNYRNDERVMFFIVIMYGKIPGTNYQQRHWVHLASRTTNLKRHTKLQTSSWTSLFELCAIASLSSVMSKNFFDRLCKLLLTGMTCRLLVFFIRVHAVVSVQFLVSCHMILPFIFYIMVRLVYSQYITGFCYVILSWSIFLLSLSSLWVTGLHLSVLLVYFVVILSLSAG